MLYRHHSWKKKKKPKLDCLICIQNRDKCASRDHLHLTVEEMRIFNARRKLKSLIVATANSIKWGHPSLDPNCDAFSDIDEDESISNRKLHVNNLLLLFFKLMLASWRELREDLRQT